MKIIQLPRGGGKTTRLIYVSEITGYPIIVSDENRKKMIEKVAKKMGCIIPEPIIFNRFKYQIIGKHPDKILIDDIETILEKILTEYFMMPIAAVTISTDNDLT